MADKTKISWADATWNPITGCTVYSPGCQRCYAMKLAGSRLKNHWSRIGLTVDSKNGPVWNGTTRFNRAWLDQPLRWRDPKAIFVCAHSDLFHESVPDEHIDEIFAIMARAPHHVFLVLTKRIARARDYVVSRSATAGLIDRRIADYIVAGKGKGWPAWPLPNLWLGTSVEDQPHADVRIPDLLATPAALHWISAEPLLGDLVLQDKWLWRVGSDRPAIRWVVAGGETQPGARWLPAPRVRALRDQCVPVGVKFHLKQWGSWLPRDQVTTPEQFDAWRKRTGILPDAGTAPLAAEVGPGIAGHLLDGIEWQERPPLPKVAA